MITDFDDAYTNGAYIPGGADFPARWATEAAVFRAAQSRVDIDRPYGQGLRHRLDIFFPVGDPKGLCIFVHGGYWMKFAKSDWSHLAKGALARGWAVALPGYTLAPEVTISGITRDVSNAITALAKLVQGPIRLAGHSAGGHLATSMICEPSHLMPETLERISQVISISGVHDLRPLLLTRMNETLKLTELEARNESPALRRPRLGIPVMAWVGANERPEFVRQSDLLANIWTGLGVDVGVHHVPNRHHFDVIEDLTEPDSALTALWAP